MATKPTEEQEQHQNYEKDRHHAICVGIIAAATAKQ